MKFYVLCNITPAVGIVACWPSVLFWKNNTETRGDTEQPSLMTSTLDNRKGLGFDVLEFTGVRGGVGLGLGPRARRKLPKGVAKHDEKIISNFQIFMFIPVVWRLPCLYETLLRTTASQFVDLQPASRRYLFPADR